MHRILVVVGMILAFGGWVPIRSGPRGFTRGRAAGLALFVVGE